ncbi:MAG: cyclase family protein [Rickettsiales bacterium]
MDIMLRMDDKSYKMDSKAHDISIAVRFDGSSICVFDSPPASKTPHVAGEFIGDVNEGGSCNCDVLTFSPHLHGTHTESVGHIANVKVPIHELLKESLIPATLVSINPQPSNEDYDPAPKANDKMITRQALELALSSGREGFHEALVIRTIPNTSDKLIKHYGHEMPPFFSSDAMHYLVELGVKHLLVDMPSIDRLADEGKLSNHHIFWGVAQGSHEIDNKNPSPKTITEFIYVPDSLLDGNYMLNLQMAAFASDATPSRPLLHKVTPHEL